MAHTRQNSKKHMPLVGLLLRRKMVAAALLCLDPNLVTVVKYTRQNL